MIARRIKHILEIMLYFLVCFFVPVKKNRIVFSCHSGNGAIGCNPKYICLEILKQKLPYDIIWLTDNKLLINDERFNNVKIIENKNTFKKMMALASSKIWIENALKNKDYQKGLFKKKNQIYINTWHGSFGIKKMFYDTPKFSDKTLWAYFFRKEIKEIDYMFASSSWEEDIYRSGLKYEGEILKIGNSRNDLFFENQNQIRKKILNYFNLDENKKILLYAPTFRDNKTFVSDLSFTLLKETLKERFNQDFIIFSRTHIQDVLRNNIELKNEIVDVTLYPDVQELLLISDILISDYSSIMFDFMLLNKPCFVYAPDVEKFNIERGLYYSLDKTPFLVSETNTQLKQNILNFNLEEYQKKCVEFIENMGVLNDGFSSKRAVEIIKKLIKN